MGKIKRKQEQLSGLKKYNLIVSTLVKDKKKSGEIYDLKDVRKQASSIYPNFKDKPLRSIRKSDIRSATPVGLLPRQRGYKKQIQVPYLDESLTNPSNETYYFNLGAFPGKIETLSSNEIFFDSSISNPELPMIQGGTQQSPDQYRKYFSNFVNYIDKQRSLKKIDYNDLRVICTPPERNPKTGVWTSRIIVTDPEGEELEPDLKQIIDNFDPLAPVSEITPIKLGKDTQLPKGSTKEELEVIERIKATERDIEKSKEEQLKAQVIADALKMLQEGKISHETFDKILSKI